MSDVNTMVSDAVSSDVAVSSEAVDHVVNNVSRNAMIEMVRKDAIDRLARTEERIHRIFASAELLESAGFSTGLGKWSTYGISLSDVPRDRLPALRQTLGKMRVSSKEVINARKRLLRIHLRFEAHPDVDATYEKKLPRNKAGAPSVDCKIVRNVTVSHVLVCKPR